MKRTITYPHAQVRLLVRAVRLLTEHYKRPVSSKDLEAHWIQHPGDRPELLQRTGQQLIKASRPVSPDRLYRIGLIGNLAYYAADNDPYWTSRLVVHEADLAIKRNLRDPFLDQVLVLRGGPQEALALNAVAGWALEMERYSQRQLKLRAVSLWPEAGEDGELARAELLALRYGPPPQQ